MAIRKEQVLALLTLAVCGLWWNSLRGEPQRGLQYAPKQLEYTAAAVREAPLAGAAGAAGVRRDFCTEPSETRPLPPRHLEFPKRAELSIAALPLDLGPDYAHALLLRTDGAVVEGVTLQSATEVAAVASGQEAPEPGTGTRAEREARAALTYDRVYVVGLNSPFFGTIETDGVDPFVLEETKDFDGVVFRMRAYNVDQQKVGRVEIYGKDDKVKVREVKLAGTLRNEVARAVRKVPVDAAHLPDRAALIRWLLDKAREATWIYDVAMEQADLYVQSSGGDLEGVRWQQRVLRAKGDMGQELALLEGLDGKHRESAFRYEGLGVLKARLGLYADAEQDLRKAASLAPTDARPHAALAEFLRQRGRSREALAAARRAEQSLGSLMDPADRGRAVRVLVACHLALAEVDEARAAWKLLPAEQPQPYLEGCVLYAAGQLPGALAAFRQAGGGPDSGAAMLGQAACQVCLGQWQDAYDAFVRVADQEPLLRHRAATGLALLHLRLGQFDTAMVWLDRAQEADPQDPYAFYLRGRTLRLMGQLAPATEALTECLRRRDDFVHAVAEMAVVHGARVREGRGEDLGPLAVAALRYIDRAVKLAHVRSVELFEVQGFYHFAAENVRGATEAFAMARDTAPTEPEKLYSKGALAVVDYSRGRVEDASAALQRLASDLGKEDRMRQWAEATLAAIDDHAQKEMLEDGFERSELGNIWPGERDGAQLGAQVLDNALVFHGPLTRGGKGEVFAERQGAVQKARNFLAVGCSMQLGKDQPRADGFHGLRIETQRAANGQADFRVMVGVREGQPHLRIEEARDEAVQVTLQVDGFDPTAVHRLELRVVPRGDQQARNFTLQVWWNGALVHTHDVKMLTGQTPSELKTILFASGSKGSMVDVRFDDYRLERRKER